MPGQVADQLKGQTFKNLAHFRREFWKKVAADDHLKKQFSKENLAEMAKGKAPLAQESQRVGGKTRYEIHHNTPIKANGGVYDLNNMTIVTPRYHMEILDPKFHFGKPPANKSFFDNPSFWRR